MANKETILAVRLTNEEKEILRRKSHEAYSTMSEFVKNQTIYNK